MASLDHSSSLSYERDEESVEPTLVASEYFGTFLVEHRLYRVAFNATMVQECQLQQCSILHHTRWYRDPNPFVDGIKDHPCGCVKPPTSRSSCASCCHSRQPCKVGDCKCPFTCCSTTCAGVRHFCKTGGVTVKELFFLMSPEGGLYLPHEFDWTALSRTVPINEVFKYFLPWDFRAVAERDDLDDSTLKLLHKENPGFIRSFLPLNILVMNPRISREFILSTSDTFGWDPRLFALRSDITIDFVTTQLDHPWWKEINLNITALPITKNIERFFFGGRAVRGFFRGTATASPLIDECWVLL